MPQCEHFVDERAEEMVDLFERGLGWARNYTNEAYVLRVIAQIRGEIETDEVNSANRPQFPSLLVATRIEPVDEEPKDEVNVCPPLMRVELSIGSQKIADGRCLHDIRPTTTWHRDIVLPCMAN